MTRRPFISSPCFSVISVVSLLLFLGLLTGCNIVAFAGLAAENYKRSSTHAIDAEYDEMRGKSFAVIVTGDRVLQGSNPTLYTRMCSRITERLVENRAINGVTGFVPPLAIAEFQITHPNWVAWGYDRLAKELEVDRLIVVEMYEYRLTEMGNQYLWDAMAAGRVGVVEAEGYNPGEFVYRKDVQVHFPDKQGAGPDDLKMDQVQGNIDKRFVDRVSWLFYKHQEPYYPDY